MKDRNQVLETLLHHLEGPDRAGRTVVLSGPWGCGKTHLWMNDMQDALQAGSATVSLFGVDSIASLKSRLVTATLIRRANLFGKADWKQFMTGLAKQLNAADRDEAGIRPAADLLGAQVDTLQVLDERLVICFDDVERASRSLSLVEILGVATLLAETRSARVLLIMNEDEILRRNDADKEVFKTFKERVVSAHVRVTADVPAVYDLMTRRYAGVRGVVAPLVEGKSAVASLFRRTANSNLRTLDRVVRTVAALDRDLGPNILRLSHVEAIAVLLMENEQGNLQGADFYDFDPAVVRIIAGSKKLQAAKADELNKRRIAFVDKYFGIASDHDGVKIPGSLCRYVEAGYFNRAELLAELRPSQPSLSMAARALDRVHSGHWYFFSDDEYQETVAAAVAALKADEEISTAVLMELVMYARLSAERAGFSLPDDFDPLVLQRLRSNAARSDRSFGQAQRIRLSQATATWESYAEQYDDLLSKEIASRLHDALLGFVRKRDHAEILRATRDDPAAALTLFSDDLFLEIAGSWKDHRQFHFYVVLTMGEHLQRHTEWSLRGVDVKGLRDRLAASVDEATRDPGADNAGRLLLAELSGKLASLGAVSPQGRQDHTSENVA